MKFTWKYKTGTTTSYGAWLAPSFWEDDPEPDVKVVMAMVNKEHHLGAKGWRFFVVWQDRSKDAYVVDDFFDRAPAGMVLAWKEKPDC